MTFSEVNIPGIQNRLFNIFHSVPTKTSNREERTRYKKILKDYEDYLKNNADAIMDVLTDSVKDLLTPDEIEEVSKKLKKIFESKLTSNLSDTLKAMENSLSAKDKLFVLKEKLVDLRDEVSKSRNALILERWTDEETAENSTVFSQVLYLSLSIIDQTVTDIESGKHDSISEVNILIGTALYLLIKFLAMIRKKVTMESLVYAMSAAQFFLEFKDTASFA